MTETKLYRKGQSHLLRLQKTLALPGRDLVDRHASGAPLLVRTAEPWTGLEGALGSFTADFAGERLEPADGDREPF
jgi:hypothetical protein